MLDQDRRERPSATRRVKPRFGWSVLFGVVGLMALSSAAVAAPSNAQQFVASTFDVIAHGVDANVGEFSVFMNGTEDENGWSVQIYAQGGIECEWWGVAADHFTDSSGEVGVQTDSPDSTGDCDGAFMHLFAFTEFTTSRFQLSSREVGEHCVATGASADYFEATVVVTHDDLAGPVEIVTSDTHYSTVEGFCHATGTAGNPHG